MVNHSFMGPDIMYNHRFINKILHTFQKGPITLMSFSSSSFFSNFENIGADDNKITRENDGIFKV